MRRREKLPPISVQVTRSGFDIRIGRRAFSTSYPATVWRELSPNLRRVLSENIAYASTNFVPLILNTSAVTYNFPAPVFEPIFFKNQLYDMIDVERSDRRKHLSLIQAFYNLECTFKTGGSTWLEGGDVPQFRSRRDVAIVPFTFGKESLLTVALCRELGIEPVLIYCEEPAHPFERDYKLRALETFSRQFKVRTHYISHESGLFRYGAAFRGIPKTELGWGAQTTLLVLLLMPFVYRYGARYMLFGNEHSNNDTEQYRGWKLYPSGFDQTSGWTGAQSNMARLLTRGQCSVHSSLEPLEESAIFYFLHTRYPEIGRFQFSCSAQHPLRRGSAWCHRCYKCARMYLFARAFGIDPAAVGFVGDPFREPGIFSHYFGRDRETGSNQELDFGFYSLWRRKVQTPFDRDFKMKKLPHLKPWQHYRNFYTTLKPARNLPPPYEKRLLRLFSSVLKQLRKNLPS
ncbi:MAG: hypothetical protein WC505_04315 [Patescibacteria group bacterium]